eukprot:Hpha_TRINITY_DN16598_c1_g3::TRINITY_DN16598_c1_g3_i1::g.132898::m.132898/K14284/NXF, TAP, MEX67; nuclear RNA export factor
MSALCPPPMLPRSAPAPRYHSTSQIRNLDLSRNMIHSLAELQNLRNFGLGEIILKDNPIQNAKEYRKSVLAVLPTVDILDQENVRVLRTALAPQMPKPAGTFIFGGGTQETVVAFCQAFFGALDHQLWDTDLTQAYDANASFSITVPRGFDVGYGIRAKELTRNLLEANHNLMAARNKERPEANLARGRIQVLTLLREKVYANTKTSHDLGGFQVDSHLIPAGVLPEPTIVATVHGVCDFAVPTAANADAVTSCRRSFDRTLVLAPNGNSSGWPARLVNDVLHIHSAVRPFPVYRPEGAGGAATGPPPPDPEQARQKALSTAFASETRLTVPYAAMCLEAAGWDNEKAKILLQERRATLPPDAWRKGK